MIRLNSDAVSHSVLTRYRFSTPPSSVDLGTGPANTAHVAPCRRAPQISNVDASNFPSEVGVSFPDFALGGVTRLAGDSVDRSPRARIHERDRGGG